MDTIREILEELSRMWRQLRSQPMVLDSPVMAEGPDGPVVIPAGTEVWASVG